MNRRRKLLLFGAAKNAQQLANAFFASVIADGGEIENEQVFVDFFQLILDHNALSFMQEHSKVLFPEARRKTSGTDNVNKRYNLFSKYGHETQTEASFQPFAVNNDLNGRSVINYNFRRRTFMPNALDFCRNVPFLATKAVHQDGTEDFSIIVNDRVETSTRYSLSKPGDISQNRLSARRLDSDSSQQITATRLQNWQLQEGQIDYANANARLIRNKNVVAESLSFLTAGNTSDINVDFVEIGGTFVSAVQGFHNERIAAIIRFNAPPPAALSEAIDDFLMDYYDLPA